MKKRQWGVSLSGLLISVVVIAVLALFGMKIGPEYMEYFQIKKAIKTIGNDPNVKTSVSEVRKAFDRQATIDNITAISPQDLEISKESGEVVISFSYERRISLFGNISLLIDFHGSSKE